MNPKNLPYKRVHDVTLDSSNGLWILARGITHYKNEKWKLYDENNTPFEWRGLGGIEVDKNGLIWFGSARSYVTYDYNKWTVHYADSIFPTDESISFIYQKFDSKGNVWGVVANGAGITGLLKFDAAPLSIVENKKEFELKITPNPASELLNININNFKKAEIYSLSGELIKGDIKSNIINIEKFPVGIYLLKVYKANKVFTSKFVKQ